MRLLIWLRLKFLESRAYVLLAEVDHAEGLMADHHRRLANCRHELAQVNDKIEQTRRRSLLAQKPERLIRGTA